jgi:hypothetical protein
MTEYYGRIARPIFVTRRSSGTAQLAQLLKCVVRATNGERVAFVGLDRSGDPVEVNDYCTMFVDNFPCEGNCWKTQTEPPLTDHVTIMSPGLVASVCTEFGCGAFFYLDTIDAPQIAGMPYEDMKAAMLQAAVTHNRKDQNDAIGKRVKTHRKKARDYKREHLTTWKESRYDGDD